MSPEGGKWTSAYRLSEWFRRKSSKPATAPDAGNRKADTAQAVPTAYMALSQPPSSAGAKSVHPAAESTVATPHEWKTSKWFEAGITMTDPTPINAMAFTASSKSTCTTETKPAPITAEGASSTPLKKKLSSVELTLASVKSKVSTVKKDPARPGTSGAEGGIIGPTIKEQIKTCIDDYNKLIEKEFPITPQYDATFIPTNWENDYTDLWQRYKEVTPTTQTIRENLDDYTQDELEDFYFEWLVLVEIIFSIESMWDDRILELPGDNCPQREGSPDTEILKLCAVLDEAELTYTPGWIFDFDLLLNNIYNGHRFEVARMSDNTFDPAAAMSRHDKYTGGAMLIWSKRRYLVKQYYQQTTLWVESDQQRSDSLVRFIRKVEQEIEPNILPTEFFTSREEDKEKGK
ncbi:hypothetical protein HDU90_007513, partial [Geranomyces variabilis]